MNSHLVNVTCWRDGSLIAKGSVPLVLHDARISAKYARNDANLQAGDIIKLELVTPLENRLSRTYICLEDGFEEKTDV